MDAYIPQWPDAPTPAQPNEPRVTPTRARARLRVRAHTEVHAATVAAERFELPFEDELDDP